MPIKYLPYVPNTVQGQAILDNITRTRRVLRYRNNDKVLERIRRGLPLYETTETETVGTVEIDRTPSNLLLRGECLSACAYLKANNIALDLVYIDPPFASGADYAKNVYLRRNPHRAAEIEAAEAELELDELRAFEEKMYGDIWNKEDYLNWMFENLTAIKSVMSETASIYVHLDYHIGHYVKILTDEVFGEDNFINEIIWKRRSGILSQSKQYGASTDTILFYSRTLDYVFHPPLTEDGTEEYISERFKYFDDKGRRYRLSPIVSPSYSPTLVYEYKGYKPPSNGWSCSRETMQRWEEEGKLVFPEDKNKRIQRKQYLDEWEGSPIQSLWDDIPPVNPVASERLNYPTQKPEALLQRIIKASSNENMIVADFFGGSGVTAKVAHDLGRRFVHVDVGVNSVQTARDRLQSAGASFRVLDIQDGVSLFRNPVQTMDKLKTLITGLRNEDGLDKFWEGAITDSKLGTVPVYLPNLLNHQTKVLDSALMSRIINEAMGDLPEGTKAVIVYYVDIYDEAALRKFIKEHNATGIEIELRDLKQILDDVVLSDEAEYSQRESEGNYEVEITRFSSDRLQQKIDEYNQKRGLTGKAKSSLLETAAENENAPKKKAAFKPIQISDNGLELIEWLSLDCTNAEGAWHSDAEIKIDKKGFVVRDGVKSKDFWNAKIAAKQKPLRLKIRNIAGDESIIALD